MKLTAVRLVTALLLAGCGSGGSGKADANAPVHQLCVITSLASSGSQAALGRGIAAGVTQVLGRGISVGSDDELRLCHQLPDAVGSAPGASATVAANASLAAQAETVAFIGETSAANATVAAEVLRQAGVPLITPSASPQYPAAYPEGTVLYLLPPAGVQAAARRQFSTAADCTKHTAVAGRARPRCTVVATGLCTGVAGTQSLIPRYCVAPGPDLANNWPTPAQAYGDAAAEVLVAALRQISNSGANPGNRQLLGRELLNLKPLRTAIGEVHFDRAGAIDVAQFSAYVVNQAGDLIFDRSIRAH